MERVAIVGLGLIGGSLGLALREAAPEVEVIGVARREETARLAQDLGVVHRAATSIQSIESADVVVLACPLGVTNQVLDDIIPHLKDGARVTDVGSVKAPVVAHAHKVLDVRRNPFLGGHPMAGKEVSGLEHAEAGLFRGNPWVFTPWPEIWSENVSSAIAQEHARTPGGDWPKEFADFIDSIRSIGAVPLLLKPADHDRYVALISHLPFLMSAAYLNAVATDPSWSDAAALASSGFRDISRLGAGSSEMYTAIIEHNREAVLDVWAELHEALDQFEVAMHRADPATLLDLFVAARQLREEWRENVARPRSQ